MAGFDAFVRRQAEALVAQFFAPGNTAWIAVPDMGWLARRQTLDGGRTEALPGAEASEALVWRDEADQAELWVAPEVKTTAGTGRYARHFKGFVSRFSQGSTQLDMDGLAVDHLYPETAAARLGFSHVRVMAVDRRSNSLLGSTVEAAAARTKTGAVRPRFATYFTLAKVSGFQGSLAKREASGKVGRALIAHLRASGFAVPADAMVDPTLEAELTASSLDWYRGDR